MTATGASFGGPGSATGDFNSPRGIAIDPTTGDLYVADVYNNRVEKFSPSGSYLSEIQTASYGAISVIAIAVSSSGELVIADYNGGVVVGFDASGTQNLLFASDGSSPGELYHPSGITFDAAGDIWVADGGNQRVEEFNPAGEYLTQFGSAGSGNGEFNDPGGLVVAPSGVITVPDLLNSRVQQFSQGA